MSDEIESNVPGGEEAPAETPAAEPTEAPAEAPAEDTPAEGAPAE